MRASRRIVAIALVSVCALLTACSSTGSTTASKPQHSKTPGAPATTKRRSPSSTTTEPTLPTGTTLPAPSTSGPLATSASVVVPTDPEPMAATEAPDGAVFMVPQTLDDQGAGPQIVWVIDGNGPAAVAEHLPGPANALAADTVNLYVANDLDVTAFNRATGNQVASWSLPFSASAGTSDSNMESMSASDGSVLVSVTQGAAVSVYKINPISSAAPRLIVQGTSAVLGPDGTVFFVDANHHLVRRDPSGSETVGPALADDPDGNSGGIQYVDTVSGGAVWVDEPAGQGLDAAFSTYTFALQPTGSFNGTVQEQIVSTTAGTLVFNGPGPCPQPIGATVTNLCVARITPQGVSSDPFPVGSAFQLLGPAPVVLTINPDNSAMVVDRLQ